MMTVSSLSIHRFLKLEKIVKEFAKPSISTMKTAQMKVIRSSKCSACDFFLACDSITSLVDGFFITHKCEGKRSATQEITNNNCYEMQILG